jgi:P4 family phage/plasmid primase-like protien
LAEVCKDQEELELIKKRYIRLIEISNKFKKTSDINNMCLELRSKCFITDFCKDINKAKNQLPLKNGLLLDMKTLQTRPRNIKDKFSIECPVNYIEKLKKEDFEYAEKYFNDLFCNNQNVIKCVIDIFKSLISGNILRYVFFLTGEGRNGKSLVIKLLNEMFGSLMKVMDKAIIIENGVKSNINTHLEKLDTIRIGYISELKENDVLNNELIKGITGGDKQDVRGLYKTNREISPTANLICACNNLPKFNVEDKALIDRLVVIPFKNRFEINSSFENELLGKMDVIFSYIMLKGVITDKFDFPNEMIEATRLYVKENDNDPLRDFLNSNIIFNIQESSKRIDWCIKRDELRKSYNSYCMSMSIPIDKRNNTNFTKAMTKLGIKSVESHNIVWYKNIQFKTGNDNDNDDIDC